MLRVKFYSERPLLCVKFLPKKAPPTIGVKFYSKGPPCFCVKFSHKKQVQLGPRYEGQLNPMAEPIPHEVRPLVRTHVYHPYHAADRQAETDS